MSAHIVTNSTTTVNPTDNVSLPPTLQRRAESVVLPTDGVQCEWCSEPCGVDVVPEVVGLEGEGLAGVGEAGGPVEAPFLRVGLVRVVKVQVGGLTHDHLGKKKNPSSMQWRFAAKCFINRRQR